MPKYMFLGKYSKAGIAAASEEGFATRPDALRPMVEANGGTLDAMYFCSPDQGFDFVLLITAPDGDLIYSMAMAGATGAAFADGSRVIELKTGEEADAILAASKDKLAQYRPPGGD